MRMAILLWAGAVALAVLGLYPSAQAASPAGPSQQVLEVNGNGDLRARTVIPAGTSRFWVIRLDGDGAGWHFRLSGPMTIGLMAEAGTNSGGSYHAGAGPAFGFNVPAWDSTLRIRTGARLGIKKDSDTAATGMIAPFLHVGIQKGN